MKRRSAAENSEALAEVNAVYQELAARLARHGGQYLRVDAGDDLLTRVVPGLVARGVLR